MTNKSRCSPVVTRHSRLLQFRHSKAKTATKNAKQHRLNHEMHEKHERALLSVFPFVILVFFVAAFAFQRLNRSFDFSFGT